MLILYKLLYSLKFSLLHILLRNSDDILSNFSPRYRKIQFIESMLLYSKPELREGSNLHLTFLANNFDSPYEAYRFT